MRIPKISIVFLSTLGAISAWYLYKGEGPQQPVEANAAVSFPQIHSFSTTSNIGQPPGPTSEVGADQFFTGAIVGEGCLTKDEDGHVRKVLETVTPDQATEKLRKNEQSFLVRRGHGVVRYDVVQLPSNHPIEDDHAEKIVPVPNTVATTDGEPSSDWMFWGVFDGHSGWTTSAKLRQELISFTVRELNTAYKAALSNTTLPFPEPATVDQALKSAFVKLDNEICLDSVDKLTENPSKRLAAYVLAPALSGSCALLSFYDAQSKILRTACSGDSRAVLGRRNQHTGTWYATPLSEDQTGSNPNEEARMRAEHPGEPHVIRNGRVLGKLEPTRAFGDAFYKWSRETQHRIKKHFFGRRLNPYLQTPPYITAEPVVTSTKIAPSNGDFVVMATDGLWKRLTNEEVVGLVVQWMDQWERGETVCQQQGSCQNENPDRFVVEDKNAATHLVRNALGGNDLDMVCALLTLPDPYSRRYRDDMTVQVIFFGEGENNGSVVVNAEATAGLKAKLRDHWVLVESTF